LQAQGDKEVLCVTVDVPPTEERLLNITLDNPEIQGTFTADVAKVLEDLRGKIKDQETSPPVTTGSVLFDKSRLTLEESVVDYADAVGFEQFAGEPLTVAGRGAVDQVRPPAAVLAGDGQDALGATLIFGGDVASGDIGQPAVALAA
jgi:hypothetical protein